ncbi:hypothetical protein [Micromonospora humidisoli]|uniref:Uncharacterized protein n=1 Tax=Micromonospora humidisoli TaxID=2807622 RepID=A0ABS2JDH6_9ACTN|nr:hypothetical protein [Micromonospora humidisoli]MBM7084582.1 hypothetical protein [Micromonospora humidisoli]
MPPGAPQVFDIPEPERGWFTQILTRAVAATALLFAGNSSAASEYATPRQRGTEEATSQPGLFDLDPAWATSSAATLALPNGISAEGTRHHAPLSRGRVLEVFRGVESHLYRELTDGRVSAYLRDAPTFLQRPPAAPADGGVYSYGTDGTVLVVRVLDGAG